MLPSSYGSRRYRARRFVRRTFLTVVLFTLGVIAGAEGGSGARAGFAAIADREKRGLFLLALSVLRDQREAEDAVQESLLLAWKAWDQLRDESNRHAWLQRICLNHCLRQRKKLSSWFFSEAADYVAAPEPVRFEGRLVDLEKGLGKLTAQQRAALTLVYLHGYSIDEAAEQMGNAAGTVRAHVARALANLRKEMNDA